MTTEYENIIFICLRGMRDIGEITQIDFQEITGMLSKAKKQNKIYAYKIFKDDCEEEVELRYGGLKKWMKKLLQQR